MLLIPGNMSYPRWKSSFHACCGIRKGIPPWVKDFCSPGVFPSPPQIPNPSLCFPSCRESPLQHPTLLQKLFPKTPGIPPPEPKNPNSFCQTPAASAPGPAHSQSSFPSGILWEKARIGDLGVIFKPGSPRTFPLIPDSHMPGSNTVPGFRIHSFFRSG